MNKEAGFTLIEVIVTIAIATVVALGGAYLLSNMYRQYNAMEFLEKKEMLRISLIGEILKDKNNCACLFKNAKNFPTSGIAKLDALPPKEVRSFKFLPPEIDPVNCDNTEPRPSLISDVGVDLLKLESISISNIRPIGGTYLGHLELLMSFSKEVMGQKIKGIRIPVAIHTKNVGGANPIQFNGCSMSVLDPPLLPEIKDYQITVRRETSNSVTTGSAIFSLCGLSIVGSGGNDGAGNDKCEVKHLGGGIWELSGKRGDDPDIICGMRCF